MKDSTRRGLRTALQLVVTLLTTGGLQAILTLLGHPLSVEAYGTISAVALPLVTTTLNSLEDAGTIPAVLKAPASDGADPAPGDDPAEYDDPADDLGPYGGDEAEGTS